MKGTRWKDSQTKKIYQACPQPHYMAGKKHGFVIRFGGAKPKILPKIA